MKYNKIGVFYNRHSEKALEKVSYLLANSFVDCVSNPHADVDAIIMLGGDGLAMRCMHTFQRRRIPFYGINYGTVGFFMNPKLPPTSTADDYREVVNNAFPCKINHLISKITSPKRAGFSLLAVNDVCISRASPTAARLKVEVDGILRLSPFIGDGIVISTPHGSTGYNLSLGGPILPPESNLLALTPIAPRMPHAWHGAILNSSSLIKISLLPSSEQCKISVDGIDYHDVTSAEIELNTSDPSILLFNSPTYLSEKSTSMMFGQIP